MLLELSFVFLSFVLILMLLYYIKRDWFRYILSSIASRIDPEGDKPTFDELPTMPESSGIRFRTLYIMPKTPRIPLTPKTAARNRANISIRRTSPQQRTYTTQTRPLKPVPKHSHSSSCSDYSDSPDYDDLRSSKKSKCIIC